MRHLSLFAGSGIGDFAAEQCGIETVAQCEIDDCCRYCLSKMFPGAKQFQDVRDVSIESLGSVLPVDIISGGFPCQDLSTAGRGAGIEGGRSGLWREMFRIIRQVRPAWILVENVPAIKLRGVDRVIAPLERIGYTCWPLVAGAWAVGAPHKRDRVWIVGRLSDAASIGCERREGDAVAGDGNRPDAEREQGDDRTEGQDSAAVADAEQDGRGPGAGVSGNKSGEKRGRGESAGGVQLADADETRRKERVCVGSRWPSRPGEPQHAWEAPRLVECGMGDAANGMAGRIRSRTNKALLRMAGNGWAWGVPLIIYRWIVETESEIG